MVRAADAAGNGRCPPWPRRRSCRRSRRRRFRRRSDRIFLEDGSARDIKAWRQSVRDDTRYKELLRASFPDMLTMIESGSDTEVQELLMANHNAQLQAMQEEQASRTGKQEL